MDAALERWTTCRVPGDEDLVALDSEVSGLLCSCGLSLFAVGRVSPTASGGRNDRSDILLRGSMGAFERNIHRGLRPTSWTLMPWPSSV